MRALMLDPPQSLLAERRKMGQDVFDEVWEGVLHMVPPPSGTHQQFGSDLLVALAPQARARGLAVTYETGLFRPLAGERDYRVPDLVVYRPEHRSKRGIEGRAEVVIELLSPDDESREKLPFYEALGTPEVFLIDHETREIELYVLRGGQLRAAVPDASGALRSQVLGIELRRSDEPRLVVESPTGRISI